MVPIRALDRKLLRDLWRQRTQALAIAAVIGAGVTMFVGYLSTLASLERAQTTYYHRYRFADVFASLARAPLAVRTDLAAIPGVQALDARVAADVTLDVPGLDEPAVGHLVSIVVPGTTSLNALVIRAGRMPVSGRFEEVVAGEAFALANHLRPGDGIGAVVNGRRRTLRIVGLALSPEYVTTARPGEIIPDNRRFGILWMERRALASAFDMDGAFNDVALTLAPGANATAVIDAVDARLARYGGTGAIPRSLQFSHWTIANELQQLRTIGLAIPLVFLGVAAFLLNVVLSRLVAVQREQIAALKALGYPNRTIGWHFAQWSLVVCAVGGGLGVAGGSWMGEAMTGIYNDYFRFPTLDFRLVGWVVAVAIAASLAAGLGGALIAVRRAVRLPPAEAMRPEPPARYRITLIERTGLARWLGTTGRLIVRNLARQPARSATSIVGIGLGASLLVLGLFFLDAIAEVLRVQFSVAQHHDVTVTFVRPRSARALHELRRLPGVLAVQPARMVPVRLRAAQRSRQIGLTGLGAGVGLQRVVDTDGRPIALPPAGLVVSRTLADQLAIRAGDAVTVEILEGRQARHLVRVTGIVDEYLGLAAYMDLTALHALMGEAPLLSGAYLQVDPAFAPVLDARLKAVPAVAGVGLRRAALDSFRAQIDDTMGVMVFFNVFFAGTIAFGVVYNAARLSLSERSRELASLRVLGFTRGEVAEILIGELALLTGIAIPLGLVAGTGFAALLAQAFQTELYRFPVVVAPTTYAIAAAVTAAAAVLSALVVRRQVDHLDLVGVLKMRE